MEHREKEKDRERVRERERVGSREQFFTLAYERGPIGSSFEEETQCDLSRS